MKLTVVICDNCENTLFTAAWKIQEADEGPSGFYLSCAQCGQVKAVVEGFQSTGEVA